VFLDTATCTGKDWIMHTSAHMPMGNYGPHEMEDPDQENCCAIGAPEQSSHGVSNMATCTSKDQGMHASTHMPMGNHRPLEMEDPIEKITVPLVLQNGIAVVVCHPTLPLVPAKIGSCMQVLTCLWATMGLTNL